ncbi:MAG: bifunctional serine/threonine-protein kinase/formylglycine-generating enzyme family protein, partial [Myxococcota bacterium]
MSHPSPTVEPFATIEADSLFRTAIPAEVSSWDDGAPSISAHADDGEDAPAGDVEHPPLIMVVPGERYEDCGLLGVGGMGEVRRVRDTVLRRTMAMKLLHNRLRPSRRSLARFIEEAQIAAQLAHPGVVPIYDLGQARDGRWFFTMQEVKGRTLAEVIRGLHTGVGDPSFRRLIDVFLRICETVAYAHVRGVIHRDLKPSNVMLSGFGRVMVLDWGLARILDDARIEVAEESVQTDRSRDDALKTRAGAITGTPAYMAPEQAMGRQDLIGPRTDVYALGAILYEILAGHPPYMGISAQAVMAAVRRGPPPPPTGPMGVPPELARLCMKAMTHDPEKRTSDAGFLVHGVSAWLDGAVRRERAAAMVDEADGIRPEVDRLYATARQQRRKAREALTALPKHAPVAEKVDGWGLEDAAETAIQEARVREAEWMQRLHGALTADPSCADASARLADFYHRRHAEAEQQQDLSATVEAEMMLRVHDRGDYAAYLRGDGALTLFTEPAGAQARLFAYREMGRRLEPVFVKNLGRTPIVDQTIPMGSYMVRLEMVGREVVDLPVNIDRQQRWENRKTETAEPTPIWMPPKGSLRPDERYVPAGWFWSGDPLVPNAANRRLRWIDSFIIEQHPVTNRRLLDYLNDTVWTHHAADALDEEFAATGFSRESTGWVLGADPDGDDWNPDWPAVLVTWDRANDFAAWWSSQTGHTWSLPTEWQWEKAARGVDGRSYPWGRHFDANWARSRYSLPDKMALATVDEVPLDRSPYGLVGTAGNVIDWCDADQDEVLKPIRGQVTAANRL